MIDTEKLQFLIEEDINLALKEHKGFCILDYIENTEDSFKIYLSFYGGCKDCPSSFSTTLNQIQNFLRIELENENIIVINTETT